MLEDIPAFGVDALAAVDVFLFEFNDLLLYVEDREQENLYLQIFKKIVPGTRVENIFPLDGKENILNHCRDNPVSRKPAFYLVDMDYDDLLNKIESDDRIIYLRRYSIENYFFEIDSIIDLIVSEHPRISRADVQTHLYFDRFITSTLVAIRPLVRAFFLTQLHDAGEKGCGLAIESFTTQHRYLIDKEKVEKYEGKLFEKLRQKNLYNSLEEMRAAGDRFISYDLKDIFHRACGKHLLSLLSHWLSEHWGVKNITHDSFSYRLASNCTFDSLKYISDRVIRKFAPEAAAA